MKTDTGSKEDNKSVIYLRVTPEIKARLLKIAESENRSINQVGVMALLMGIQILEEELSIKQG